MLAWMHLYEIFSTHYQGMWQVMDRFRQAYLFHPTIYTCSEITETGEKRKLFIRRGYVIGYPL